MPDATGRIRPVTFRRPLPGTAYTHVCPGCGYESHRPGHHLHDEVWVAFERFRDNSPPAT